MTTKTTSSAPSSTVPDWQATVDRSLLDTARELGPTIEQYKESAEQERRPRREVIEALTGAGMLRLLLPKSLGGFEADPVSYARVVEQVASFDSVAGWALQAGNHVAWWCARLPEEGVEELYGRGPDTLVAAAFHPPHPTVEADGGYSISGRAPLASNIQDADWLLLSGLVIDDGKPRTVDGAPQLLQLILPAHQVEVVDTWYALGMRGSDSNDVEVNEVFVPSHRTFPLTPQFEPGSHFQGPLYRFPGVGIIVTIFAPVMLAIGRNAIDALSALAREKTPFGSSSKLQGRASVQTALARAEAKLRAARSLFYQTIAAAWQRTLNEEEPTLDHKADLMLAGTYAVDVSAKVADMMHQVAGTSGIYEGAALERHFRDAQTLRHHGFLSTSRYETVGQVYLGVQPEFALVQI